MDYPVGWSIPLRCNSTISYLQCPAVFGLQCIIPNSSNSSCELDPLPTILLDSCIGGLICPNIAIANVQMHDESLQLISNKISNICSFRFQFRFLEISAHHVQCNVYFIVSNQMELLNYRVSSVSLNRTAPVVNNWEQSRIYIVITRYICSIKP